jgi:hypothetical protein
MRNLKDIILEKLKVDKNSNVIYPVPYAEIESILKSYCKSIADDDTAFDKYNYDGEAFVDDYLDVSAFDNIPTDIKDELMHALFMICGYLIYIYRIEYLGSTEDYLVRVENNQYKIYIKGALYKDEIPNTYKYFLPGYQYTNNLKYGYTDKDLITFNIGGSDLDGFIFAKTKERLIELIDELNEDTYYINYDGDFSESDIVYIDDYDNKHPHGDSIDTYTDVQERLDDVKKDLEEYIESYNELIDELIDEL